MLPHVADFPTALKTARKTAGLSQKQLGALLDDPVTGSMVSLWESGENKPTAAHARNLETILNQDGVFTALLGYATDPDLLDRVAAIEDRLAAIEDRLRRLGDAL